MKTLKQILAIAMVVMMGVVFMPMVPGANGVAKADANVAKIEETGNEYATVQEAVNAAQSGETVKLLSDVDLTSTIDIANDKNFTLDLNGKTLDGSSIAEPKNMLDKASVIFINKRTTLTLNDSSTGTPGKITGGKGYIPYTQNNQKYTYGGGVCMNDGGTLNLYKISITGNTANYGGGVYVRSGTFNMYSGKISNNKAYYVLRSSDQVKIGGYGGGVMLAIQLGDDCRVNVYGGEISGNSVNGNNSGGVHLSSEAYSGPSLRYKAILTVSGAAKITGNIFCENGITRPANVYVQKSSPIIIGQDGLKPGAEIGALLSSGDGTLTTNGTADDAKYFSSDSQAYKVKYVAATEGESPVPAHIELVNIHNLTYEANATNKTITATCSGHSGCKLTDNKVAATLSAESKEYTGKAYVGASIIGKDAWDNAKAATLSFTYKGRGDTEYVESARAPKATGKYTVIMTAKNTGKSVSADFEITPAEECYMVTGSAVEDTNTLRWKIVEDAVGYDIYYAKGKKSLKYVDTTAALEYTKDDLNKKSVYRYRVKAYKIVEGEKVYIEESPIIYIAGSKVSRSNAEKVEVSNSGVLLPTGRSYTVKAKITEKSSKKTVLYKGYVNKFRYKSSDTSVATVTSGGKIKAKSEGIAYVYAYAASGAYAKVKVIVNVK